MILTFLCGNQVSWVSFLWGEGGESKLWWSCGKLDQECESLVGPAVVMLLKIRRGDFVSTMMAFKELRLLVLESKRGSASLEALQSTVLSTGPLWW